MIGIAPCERIGMNSILGYRRSLIALLVCVLFASVCSAQQAVITGRYDLARTSSNTLETMLTPSNVNKNGFGRLFNYPIDYQALAQPLYVPNVTIPGLGTHNVVYVATMADSVYAFDADSNQGANSAPLWSVNFTNPANGITTASVATGTLPCATTESAGPGFIQEGIVSTPAIDPNTGTMYVVAKTLENGVVRHHLHALDITNGQEKFGGPVLITATFTSNKGRVSVLNSLHQKNRPGLLLLNGMIYLGFGSNFCNDISNGWVLSYNASTLAPGPVFNASPDKGLASIWQSGQAIPADENGLIYVETSESGSGFDVNNGGQSYSDSVVELNPASVDPNFPNQYQVPDYFTPTNWPYLNAHDFDLSSTGALVLPTNSNWATPRELIAAGKQGVVYVLNRDHLGMYSQTTDQVLQEFALEPGVTIDVLFSSPAYWNNTVYFAPNGSPLLAFPLSGGLLQGTPPCSVGPNSSGTCFQTSSRYTGAHSPSISANGNTNGVLWFLTGVGQLAALDATTLKQLYSTNQVSSRDALPTVAHFATQTVVNGKVYVATRTTLEVYGLLDLLAVTSGANQSATVLTALAYPIIFRAVSPYTGVGIPGVSVSFSDGGKGGIFNPPTATTDSNGNVSTSYTFPSKSGIYAITASAANLASGAASETAVPGLPTRLIAFGGPKQTGTVGTVLPKSLIAQAQDAYKNGVPGVTVNFAPPSNGIVNPSSVVTDSNGKAATGYQLPTKAATLSVMATSSPGLNKVPFSETGVAGNAANISVVSGNNQIGAAGTQLPAALTIVVTDQYGNPVSGAAVTFSDGGAGGSFSYSNPVTADSTGTAGQFYTLPSVPGTISITASAAGVNTPAVFTETAN
jgi:hypothetical protein